MSQLNIQMTPDFERALRRLMESRGIKTESEAVRAAVEEAVEKEQAKPKVSWEELRGLGNKGVLRPREQWLSEDDLWGEHGDRR